jgi:hypothetical protein
VHDGTPDRRTAMHRAEHTLTLRSLLTCLHDVDNLRSLTSCKQTMRSDDR